MLRLCFIFLLCVQCSIIKNTYDSPNIHVSVSVSAHTFAIAQVVYKLILFVVDRIISFENNIFSQRHVGVNEKVSNRFMSLLVDALKRNEIHMVSLCRATIEMNNCLSD